MEEKEFVAYRGEHYIIEWYFDSKSLSQPLEYYRAMSNTQKRKLLMLFKRIGNLGGSLIKQNSEMNLMEYMRLNRSQIDFYHFSQRVGK